MRGICRAEEYRLVAGANEALTIAIIGCKAGLAGGLLTRVIYQICGHWSGLQLLSDEMGTRQLQRTLMRVALNELTTDA